MQRTGRDALRKKALGSWRLRQEAEEVETEPESEDRARELDGRAACSFCGRKFNPMSLRRHEPVCQKAKGTEIKWKQLIEHLKIFKCTVS